MVVRPGCEARDGSCPFFGVVVVVEEETEVVVVAGSTLCWLRSEAALPAPESHPGSSPRSLLWAPWA